MSTRQEEPSHFDPAVPETNERRAMRIIRLLRSMDVQLLNVENQVAVDAPRALEWAERVVNVKEKYNRELGSPAIDLWDSVEDKAVLEQINLDPADKEMVFLACQQFYNRYLLFRRIGSEPENILQKYFNPDPRQFSEVSQEVTGLVQDPELGFMESAALLVLITKVEFDHEQLKAIWPLALLRRFFQALG